jgi:hypothetical protein
MFPLNGLYQFKLHCSSIHGETGIYPWKRSFISAIDVCIPRRRWKDNIKMYLQEMGWIWTGVIWRRTGTGGGNDRTGNFLTS